MLLWSVDRKCVCSIEYENKANTVWWKLWSSRYWSSSHDSWPFILQNHMIFSLWVPGYFSTVKCSLSTAYTCMLIIISVTFKESSFMLFIYFTVVHISDSLLTLIVLTWMISGPFYWCLVTHSSTSSTTYRCIKPHCSECSIHLSVFYFHQVLDVVVDSL